MKKLLSTVLVLCVSSLVLAEEKAAKPTAGPKKLSDPLEILKRADKATGAVKSVQYKSRLKGTGALERAIPPMVADVIMQGEDDSGFDRLHLKVEWPAIPLPRPIEIGKRGDQYWMIDHKDKKVIAGSSSRVYGPVEGRLQLLAMREFSHSRPFGDEMKSIVKLKGITKVGDQECYEIHVKYSDPEASESTWWFATEDLLPRKVERFQMTENGPAGSVQTTIEDLKVSPKHEKNPFEMKVPEGYEKVGV